LVLKREIYVRETQTQTQRRTRRSLNKNEMGKMGIIRVGIRVLIFCIIWKNGWGRIDVS
jgi:hypothetical protein